jgi:hypothetical protein
MLKLENERVLLTMDEDGSNLVILDKLRRQRWRLDESTRYTAGGPGRGRFFDDIQPSRLASSGIANIGPAQCRQQGGGSIVCAHRGPAGAVELEWILGADGLRLVATAPNEGGVANLALPGAFEPVDDAGHVQPFVSAVPECQGLLHTGKGKSFCRTLGSNHGHISGLNMDMFGQLSPRGGLLVIGETPTDATLLWEKTHEGRMRLAWLQGESFGRLSYPRETVLLLTPPDLTALCKSYRRYEMGNGRF